MINFLQKVLLLSLNKKWLFTGILLLVVLGAMAQPANDGCNNASIITIPNGGFATGKFTSATFDITGATLQTDETFAPAILVAGQNKKSMWYKFSTSTVRAIRVTLGQPGTTITAGDAGFSVYKANSCVPSSADISSKLTPIGTFGNTFHPCVDSGVYYIQVSANNKANGPLFVEVQVSDTTGAQYDHPKDAYDFGVVTPHVRHVDYTFGCHSIEDASEICASFPDAKKYYKSSWHTFTTPDYFDYISVLLTKSTNGYFINWGTQLKFGYRIYKGDAKKEPMTSLVPLGSCDSIMTNGYSHGYKMYKCDDLEPNTTYSIQLFGKEDFYDDIRVSMISGGIAPTQSPTPVSTPSNDFDILQSATPRGTTKTLSDYLGCNSRHTASSCSPALPSDGVVFDNITYNLSTFFTFTLNTASTVDFHISSVAPTGCGPLLKFRLFQQGLTANCADLKLGNLIGTYNYNSSVDCLWPGTYTVQVLGTDANVRDDYFYFYATRYDEAQCLASNLGNKINLSLTATRRVGYSKFSLSVPGAYDTINNVNGIMTPLSSGIIYNSAVDTFGCINTVRPVDTTCGPERSKVMYRQFAVADSGVVAFDNFGWYPRYKLYHGDANALATAQNVFTYPSFVNGLKSMSDCFDYYTYCDYKSVCVTPGTYTLTSFGSDAHVGISDQPRVKFEIVKTLHDDPLRAQDLGNILDSIPVTGGSITSDVDAFSCKDNAVPINGYMPCAINRINATKAIYRQFYLKNEATISITNGSNNCNFANGVRTLFYGKATDGITKLTPVGGKWSCFNTVTSSDCETLPAGWYTVVSYGSGPTYENPFQNLNQANGYSSFVGRNDQFTIKLTVCPGPKYNRPHKAAVDAASQPFLVQWKPRFVSTPAYPRTDTTYSLGTEYFNCTNDTPFIKHPVIACDTTITKVAYFVFRTTQESYAEINTGSLWAMVYPFDVRKDSALMAAANPIQPCVKGNTKIQLCKLPAGVYTLVVFAPADYSCNSVSPTIYIDQVQGSRFDHAKNAYDFGTVPADSSWHRGKVGDVNPVHPLRAPSSDFFSCITGSQPTDPGNAACMTENVYNMYNPSTPYMYAGDQGGNVDIVRRNLWYTFVVDKPGRVYVKVENKTPGKVRPYRFAVYRSDVNGTIDFSTVVSTGQVDSSLAQGLTLIGHNGVPNYCNALTDGINFYRDPCTQFAPQRYYILIENRNPYWYDKQDAMNPNNQVEVAILIDSVNMIATKFDHYSTAYDFGKVGVGKHTGAVDNYSCATRDATDPIIYANGCTKTLWYKFTSTVTGTIRYRIKIKNNIKYYGENVQLFKEAIAGDSTSKGLVFQAVTTIADTDHTYWMQCCVSPGVYYLILPGCGQVNEDVYPEIELLEQEGDFCSRPVSAPISGPGSSSASVLVNCHTIGTDYGEFNQKLSCPADGITNQYKSSWFRIDITGKDTLDVTTYLTENTNVQPSQIKYRMMTGDCNAMQEQSCVQDAQTQNTYKCLTAGSYYIQVFTPIHTAPGNNVPVTGDIQLNLSAVSHVDTCAPVNQCLANANFIPQFDCTKDKVVRFANFSTYGSTISYAWDFGYNRKTSTDVSPEFNYPALDIDATYQVTLTVTNKSCGDSDKVTIPVTIPARPKVDIGKDTTICSGNMITLNAASWPGTTYAWNNYTGNASNTINLDHYGYGEQIHWVKAAYKGCVFIDTIKITYNTIQSKTQVLTVCNGDPVTLSSARNREEEHLWSTGETTASISVKDAGMYYNKMNWKGCTIIDTFSVIKPGFALGNDTAVCFNKPFKLDVSMTGATYVWQDNSTASIFEVKSPGAYWVTITLSGCTITDTIHISGSIPVTKNVSASICNGDTYTLPSGKTINAPGTYKDTLRSRTGCDSLVTIMNLSIQTLKEINLVEWFCSGNTFTLPWGATVNAAGTYSHLIKSKSGCDSVKYVVQLNENSLVKKNISLSLCSAEPYRLPSGTLVKAPGIYNDTLHYQNGCDSLIAVVNLTLKAAATKTISANICSGSLYQLPSGKMENREGIYRDTLRYISGCDSLVFTIDLKVAAPLYQNISSSICAGQKYTLPSGAVVTQPGTYKDILHYKSGCDSVITTVVLTTNILTRKNISAAVCEGQFYQLPSGVMVSRSGVYADTLRYASGCDSVIHTITLTSKPVFRKNITAAVCSGQAYTLPSGKQVYTQGVYTDIIHYQSGCDSLISTVDLTVMNVTTNSISHTICKGESFTLPSGLAVTNAGIYTDVIKSRLGCDSVITKIQLRVDEKPSIRLTKSNDITCHTTTAILTASGAQTYNWSPANTLSSTHLPRVTASPFETTTYTVEAISAAGCVAKDSIKVTVNKGDAGNSFLMPNAFTPNGDNLNDCFGARHWGAVIHFKMTIYNRFGNIVFETTDASRCWNGTYKGIKADAGAYTYQISAKTICGDIYRKGVVMLLR